jgi:hypothetical protein
MVMQIIEISAVLIGIYLVLTNANAFKTAFGAIGTQYTNAVSVLQGPKKNG